jgi:triacylglycerol lipase
MLRIGRALFFGAVGAALVAACSGGAPEDGTGTSTGSVYTGVSGVGGGHTSSHATTSAVTSGSGGQGGQGGALAGPPYPVVLAHGFFGFNDFAGAGFLTYFYDLKDYLATQGETVFTPAVDPFNDSTYRGAQLAQQIDLIRQQTGAAKVIIIGHSQGGLDARVVAHDHPDRVAAVVTIATPHNGTPIADVALKLIADPNAASVIDNLVNLVGAPLYDQIGNTTAVSKPLYLFSQPGIAAFNAAYPDDPNVFYASIAGRSALAFGGQDCAVNVSLPFIKAADTEKDPLDALFWATELVVEGDIGNPVVNDGLVRARDARHGQFWGCVPADHLDEVGQLAGDSPGIGNNWDYKAFYRDLIKHLRTLGY